MRLKAGPNGGIPPQFFPPLAEMKDNRVTTLHFSPFAAHQMYSEALYFAERDPLFFNSISRTNFLLLLPLRAKQKEQVFGLFVMFPPFASSPPIRLLYYLADVYQGREIISKTKKTCDLLSSCPKNSLSCSGISLRRRSNNPQCRSGKKNHLHFTHSSNPLTGLLLHQCGDISKARMSIGSFPSC